MAIHSVAVDRIPNLPIEKRTLYLSYCRHHVILIYCLALCFITRIVAYFSHLTVVDTFAQGHYKDSARQAGFAATKCQKYHDLQSNNHLQPVAIETTSVYGKSTTPFLSGLAKKHVDVSGDPRECQWLQQRLSLAVVRGNAASILACVRV